MYNDLKRATITVEYFDIKKKEICSTDVSTDNCSYINELLKLTIDKISKCGNGFVTNVFCNWSTIDLNEEKKEMLEVIKNDWKEKVREEYLEKIIYCLRNSNKDILCKHILSMLDDVEIER